MLKPKRKIVKKELKQDALVSTYTNLTSFYMKHKKRLGTAATVVVILVLAVVVYTKNERSNNESAALDLAKITPYFDKGEYQSAIDGFPEQEIHGLESIAHNYGGTTAGEQARFYLAMGYYQLGKYDEALSQFEDLESSNAFLLIARLEGIGACYEAKSEYLKAATNYEDAAAIRENDLRTPENLSRAAMNYALAGNKEKAVELYKKLKKDHPTTTFGREADRYISELSV